MKRFFKIFALIVLPFFAMSFLSKDLITWNKETIDVGVIPQNQPKTVEFVFKNESGKEVLITSVQGSCGCTSTDYTKTAIPVGGNGYVKAIYNAAAKGQFTKTVTVTTNAETTPKVLTLKGEVK